MADYVDADTDDYDGITHFPNDGHPQCASIELDHVPTERDLLEAEYVEPGKYMLAGQTFDNEDDYRRALRNIAIAPLPQFHKTPITVQDQIREINQFGWKETIRNPEYHAGMFLRSLGVDLTSEHHRDTPRRLAEAMRELTHREQFKFTTFAAKSQNMITLGPVRFYTMCAHHTLPFHGDAYIGYVPNERIAGLSKFARAVEFVAKGFHVQEELTTELHNFLATALDPKGLAVVMRAEHMCMAMRGVKQRDVITTTSEMSGVFADHTRTAKAEFMEWIRNG